MDYFEINSNTGVIRLSKVLLPELTKSKFDSSLTSFGLAFHYHSTPKCTRIALSHQLLVLVQDNQVGSKPNSNYTLVEIHLNPGPGALDRFECPHFTSSLHPRRYLTVDENVGAGFVITSFMSELQPRTALPGFVTFHLIQQKHLYLDRTESGESSIFYVTPDTGLLINLVRLDREQHGDYYEVVVEVRGSNGICQKMCDLITVNVGFTWLIYFQIS